MLAEQLTDDEATEILALALSESDLDFVSLIRETMDDLAGGRILPPEFLEIRCES